MLKNKKYKWGGADINFEGPMGSHSSWCTFCIEKHLFSFKNMLKNQTYKWGEAGINFEGPMGSHSSWCTFCFENNCFHSKIC